MKTERIGIRITKELKDRLKILAQRDHRTFSNYIEMVLAEHADENKNNTHRHRD